MSRAAFACRSAIQSRRAIAYTSTVSGASLTISEVAAHDSGKMCERHPAIGVGF